MIHHVALETSRRDRERAVEFWRLVGFAEVDPPATLADRADWLQLGPTQVHLLWSDSPVAPPQGHAAVHISDYDETLRRLRDAGYAVEDRPEHWGAARAFARAPGGHRVELMAAPPP